MVYTNLILFLPFLNVLVVFWIILWSSRQKYTKISTIKSGNLQSRREGKMHHEKHHKNHTKFLTLLVLNLQKSELIQAFNNTKWCNCITWIDLITIIVIHKKTRNIQNISRRRSFNFLGKEILEPFYACSIKTIKMVAQVVHTKKQNEVSVRIRFRF